MDPESTPAGGPGPALHVPMRVLSVCIYAKGAAWRPRLRASGEAQWPAGSGSWPQHRRVLPLSSAPPPKLPFFLLASYLLLLSSGLALLPSAPGAEIVGGGGRGASGLPPPSGLGLGLIPSHRTFPQEAPAELLVPWSPGGQKWLLLSRRAWVWAFLLLPWLWAQAGIKAWAGTLHTELASCGVYSEHLPRGELRFSLTRLPRHC